MEQNKSLIMRISEKKKPLLVIIIIALIGSVYLIVSNAAAPSVPSGYREVFKDEFDSTSLNTNNWKAYNNTYGDGNFETHCLTPNNVTTSNGTLKILSKQEQVECPSYSSSQGWRTPFRPYTSGFIGSRDVGKYYPKYGRYEIRAKSPQRLGIVPAIWLRHINGSSVVEIDMLESFQSAVGTATSTIHATNGSGSTIYNAWKRSVNIGTTPQWHTWAVEIEEIDSNTVEIRFYLDGELLEKNGGGGPYRITGEAKKQAFDNISENGFDIAINTAVNFNYGGNAYPDSKDWHCKDSRSWYKVSNPSQADAGSKVAETPMKNADGSTFYRACNNWASVPETAIQNNPAGEVFEIDYVRVMVKDEGSPPPEPTECPVWTYKGASNGVNISEASGIIASRNQPGVFWMHNDSGGSNQIWAIDSTGKVLSRHVLSGATANDWEDISFGPGPDPSKDYIYVGDVGTKNRSAPHVVYRVPEPTVNASDNNAQYSISSSQLKAFTIDFELANGGSKKPDIEGMAVDPLTSDIYFFDKELNARDQNGVNGMSYVFRVDGSGLTNSGTFTALEIANVVGNVDSQSANTYPPGGTAADISADGQMLAMQNYDEIFIWNRNGGNTFVDALNAPLDGRAPCYYADADITGSTIPGSEAMAFSPDGKELSFITEGLGSTIRTFENTNSTDPPPPPTKLATVSGLTATAQDGQVVLDWNDVQGADNYTVRWGTGGTWTNYSNEQGNSNNPTSSNYTVTGLTNGITYNFSVGARDSSGTSDNGDYSTTVTATPSAPPVSTKLGNVTGLSATEQDGQITLTWNEVQGADNYTVRWGTEGSFTTYSNDIGSNPTSNSYIVTGLTNGTTYNFSVAARDSTGVNTNGDYSSAVTATPQATPTVKLGDVDRDGDVDLTDLARLLSDYGKTGTQPADFNKNGVVDLADLAFLLSNYGK